MTEDEFEEELLRRGMLERLPQRREPDYQRPAPITIQGKPLSETIIEERR